MPLTENRKISILIGWFFLIGLIAWLFFSRLSQQKKQDASISFTTQSIGTETWISSQTYDIACPWEQEILLWNRVVLWNPLLEKSVPIVSMQQWLLSSNYDLYGPVWWTTLWKASWIREEIDWVESVWKWSYGECIYSIWSQKVVALRHTDLEDCTAKNTPNYIWFSCVQED
jgi:hypothetical protein